MTKTEIEAWIAQYNKQLEDFINGLSDMERLIFVQLLNKSITEAGVTITHE